jgi:hypothetical protein
MLVRSGPQESTILDYGLESNLQHSPELPVACFQKGRQLAITSLSLFCSIQNLRTQICKKDMRSRSISRPASLPQTSSMTLADGFTFVGLLLAFV